MPLVRIDVVEGRSEGELRKLADVVQEVMLDVFAAPDRERYQVIHEHNPGRIIAEDTGLGFEHTDDIVVIQVIQQGRRENQKSALRRARRPAPETGRPNAVRPDRLRHGEHESRLVLRPGSRPVPVRRLMRPYDRALCSKRADGRKATSWKLREINEKRGAQL